MVTNDIGYLLVVRPAGADLEAVEPPLADDGERGHQLDAGDLADAPEGVPRWPGLRERTVAQKYHVRPNVLVVPNYQLGLPLLLRLLLFLLRVPLPAKLFEELNHSANRSLATLCRVGVQLLRRR